MEEEIRSSKFNAGILQTERVNKILELSNSVKLNLTAYNDEHCDYNYYIYFRCINNLYGEVVGFMKKKESEYCLKLKQQIENLFKQFPIRINNKNPKLINYTHYETIEKALIFYDNIVKYFGVKYKLLSTFEKPAGLI